jgi:probable rRNA maturation factor
MNFEIDLCNRQNAVPVDLDALEAAVLQALELEQVASAVLSISIVSNEEIHTLNRDHLDHDYATDVISFQLDFADDADFDQDEDADIEDNEDSDDESDNDTRISSSATAPHELRAAGALIEGEIIASAEMASSMAADGQWSTQDELTLYVVHGLLHICGYDDLTEDEKVIIRARERAIMAALGLKAIYAEDAAES